MKSTNIRDLTRAALLTVLTVCPVAAGQSINPDSPWADTTPARQLDTILSRPVDNSSAYSSHIHLLNMPSALPGDPLGMMPDTDPVLDDPFSMAGSDGLNDRLQLNLGADNPFFDLRRRRDPGGVGSYRFYSQAPIFDSHRCYMSFVFQGVTPAGLEAQGVAEGPTILSPSFACFYQLSPNGAGIHVFACKDLEAHSRWTNGLPHDYRYGLAYQSPLPGLTNTPCRGVQFYVEALGRWRTDNDFASPPPSKMDMLPGLHYQVGENWWVTGGLLVPVGPQRADAHHWQLTTSWRF